MKHLSVPICLFFQFFFLNQPELAMEFDLNFQVISASSYTARF